MHSIVRVQSLIDEKKKKFERKTPLKIVMLVGILKQINRHEIWWIFCTNNI